MLEETTATALGLMESLGIDVLALVAVVGLLMVWGLVKGKRGLLTLLVSLYPALLIADTFPWYARIPSLEPPAASLAVFLGVTMVLFMLLKGYVYSTFPHSSIWRFTEVAALALGVLGLTVSSLYNPLGIEGLYDLSPLLDTIFAGTLQHFVWTAGPLAALFLFVRSS